MPDTIYIGQTAWDELKRFLRSEKTTDQLFILTDHHTKKYCLPAFLGNLPELADCPVFSVQPGERSKSVSALSALWHWLISCEAGRDAVLINLGGGVISDLGGFTAATYQRGIRYINIPTTLIAQADASIGGKTGINVTNFKNQAGCFYFPEAVFIIPSFLETLPKRQLASGFGELVKSAILSGKGLDALRDVHPHDPGPALWPLILSAVTYKKGLIELDPLDRSARKALNFGHSIGHGLESCSQKTGLKTLMHGEAVAAGMICEAFISAEVAGLSASDLLRVTELASKIPFSLSSEKLIPHELIRFILADKKNRDGQLFFTLLGGIGRPKIDVPVEPGLVLKALDYLYQVMKK